MPVFALTQTDFPGIYQSCAGDGDFRYPATFPWFLLMNNLPASYLVPPMTTIEQQKSEIGRPGRKMILLRYIQTPRPAKPVAIKLKARLIERDSVKRMRQHHVHTILAGNGSLHTGRIQSMENSGNFLI